MAPISKPAKSLGDIVVHHVPPPDPNRVALGGVNAPPGLQSKPDYHGDSDVDNGADTVTHPVPTTLQQETE